MSLCLCGFMLVYICVCLYLLHVQIGHGFLCGWPQMRQSVSVSRQYWLNTAKSNNYSLDPTFIYFIHTNGGLSGIMKSACQGCVIHAMIPSVRVYLCLSVSDCVFYTTITVSGERDCAINKSIRWQQKLIKGDHWWAEGRLEGQGGAETKKL